MTGRAAIHSCSLVLAHAPDLVRHGSKPARELAADSDGLLASLTGALRSYEDALGYPPHQVLIGNLRPDELWDVDRPWWVIRSSRWRRALSGSSSTRPSSTGGCRRPTRSGSSTSTEARPRTADWRSTRPGSCRLDGRRARPRREPVGRRPAREPRLQGDRRACARAPAAGDRPRPRRRALRDRERGGGGRRPLSARRGQSRQGDRRAGGVRQRLGKRREGVLLRPGARARRRRIARRLRRLPLRRRCGRWVARQAGDEVLRRAAARGPDSRRRAGRLRGARRAARRRSAGASPRRRRSAPGRLGLGPAGGARGPRRRAAGAARPRDPRRRPLRDRAARPRDHGAGRGGQCAQPELQADRRPRGAAWRAAARGARRLRTARTACPASRRHRVTSPLPCRGSRTGWLLCAPARSARPCCWRRARSSSAV